MPSGLPSHDASHELTSLEDGHAVSQIVKTLGRRYGLQDAQLQRLQMGQATKNYRAVGAEFVVFVKRYLPGTDLDDEREAIRLSELARSAGIPTAPVIANSDTEWIDQSSAMPISVWAWVPGSVRTTGLRDQEHAAAGHALGAIHRTFSGLPESRLQAVKSERWRQVSVRALSGTLDSLRAEIARRLASGTGDDFDHAALDQLAEKEARLAEFPVLLESLPPLTSQVLHGDFSAVNILFDDAGISAVLDFRPPRPFLIAYELGRIAFNPNTVAREPDWLDAAYQLTRAYLAEHPPAGNDDILQCGRVYALQLLKSFYGIKEHYFGPALIQSDLDAFWTVRHRATSILMDNIRDVDEMLRSAVAEG